MTLVVRHECPPDIPLIRAINDAAFGDTAEGRIVDALRSDCPGLLSLVAEDTDGVVGHILFSPVALDHPAAPTGGMGLAPMAVRPDRQRRGVGSLLVTSGLERLREDGCPFVIVLGHAEYYPRFGFVPASRHGLACQWQGVPDEAFMVLMCQGKSMEGLTGTVRYRSEFDQAM